MVSLQKKEYLNMQTSLLRHFDAQYSFLSLLGIKKPARARVEGKELDTEEGDRNVLHSLYPNEIKY